MKYERKSKVNSMKGTEIEGDKSSFSSLRRKNKSIIQILIVEKIDFCVIYVVSQYILSFSFFFCEYINNLRILLFISKLQ